MMPSSVMRTKSALAIGFVTALVAIAYALPLVAVYVKHGAAMHISVYDDTFYAIRVVAASRGADLANPYLSGHENSVRYLPELSERTLGTLARVLGISAREILLVSHVFFPTAVFLLTLTLSQKLGLPAHWAMVAGAAPTLAPSLGHFFTAGDVPMDTNFLRYFRLVSPPVHVCLFLLGMILLYAAWSQEESVWKSRRLATIIAAGITLGFLADTPMFYWTLAYGGLATLAATSRGPSRLAVLLVLLVTLAVAFPFVVRAFAALSDPGVIDSLNRTATMQPIRALEPGAVIRFAACWPPILALWYFRRGRPEQASWFLLPFLVPSAFFFLQSVITGQQVEAYHWANPLIPLWSIAIACGASEIIPERRSRTVAFAAIALLASTGTMIQAASLPAWETICRTTPDYLCPNMGMPQTLQWLDDHTPPDSVVLSTEGIMHSLPMFTHNRVFWADYAVFHAVSQAEHIKRYWYVQHGPPGFRVSPPYRLDYYLGAGVTCRQLSRDRIVFENREEGTCVWSFSR